MEIELQNKVHRRICVKGATFLAACSPSYVIFVTFFVYSLTFSNPASFHISLFILAYWKLRKIHRKTPGRSLSFNKFDTQWHFTGEINANICYTSRGATNDFKGNRNRNSHYKAHSNPSMNLWWSLFQVKLQVSVN